MKKTNKYEVTDVMTTTSASWYMLWKCKKYNEY